MKKYLTLALLICTCHSIFCVTTPLELVIPKLSFLSRNTPSGTENWAILNATTNNASKDYWKMLSNSELISPTINLATHSDIVIALSLQSFGTISNHSDDIAVFLSNGNTWTQIGENLHTTSTSGIQQVNLGSKNRVGKIRVVAPNATNTVGARVMSVEIKGIASTTPAISTNEDTIPVLLANMGDSVVHKLTIAGANLQQKINIQLTGKDSSQFKVSVDSISTLNANMTNVIEIKFKPSSEGNKQASLLISSQGASPMIKAINASTHIATLNTTEIETMELLEENGHLFFQAKEAEVAQLYGINGQLLQTTKTTEGWNQITWSVPGIYLLKCGKSTRKILLKN